MPTKTFEMVIETPPTALQAKLKKLGSLSHIAVAQTINQIADNVIGDAQELAPVRKSEPNAGVPSGGALRRSAFVEHAVPSAAPRAVVGFGVKYGWPVHENPRTGKTGGVSPKGRRYKSWARTGQWHFLEVPFNLAKRTFRRDVGRIIAHEWAAFLK